MCAVDILGVCLDRIFRKDRRGDTLLDWAKQARE
jgi:hypothetical protein